MVTMFTKFRYTGMLETGLDLSRHGSG